MDTAKVKIKKKDALTLIATKFDISDDIIFITKGKQGNNKDKLGFTHERYKQHYKGVPLEFSDLRLHFFNDDFISSNGEIISSLKVNMNPKISEEQALQYALKYINADKYIWQFDSEEQ